MLSYIHSTQSPSSFCWVVLPSSSDPQLVFHLFLVSFMFFLFVCYFGPCRGLSLPPPPSQKKTTTKRSNSKHVVGSLRLRFRSHVFLVLLWFFFFVFPLTFHNGLFPEGPKSQPSRSKGERKHHHPQWKKTENSRHPKERGEKAAQP